MKHFSDSEGYNTAPYKVEVHGVGDPINSWSSNGIRFDTKEEARTAALDLSSRWFGMDRWRVIEVRLSDILKEKRKDVDCNEDESAYIKGWLRETVVNVAFGEVSIEADIKELFPLEYDEVGNEEN